MKQKDAKTACGNLSVQQWLEIRKEAGKHIDTSTAEVMWIHARTFDPYGVHSDPPGELQQIGRVYFARSPGNDIWVWFGDLPGEVRERLWGKHSSKLAFPSGLSMIFQICN
jgi:hypothetical protein